MTGSLKSILPVILESNKMAQVMMDIFQNWFVSNFCPSVKRHCEKHNIGPKALLLLQAILIIQKPLEPAFLYKWFTYILQERCLANAILSDILKLIFLLYESQACGGVVIKALHYKPAGRGFDSRWCQWNFSLT